MLDETFAEALVHRHVPLRARLWGFLQSPFTDHHSRPQWSGHCILGIRLRPFSFWCAAWLDFIGSPFLGARPKNPNPDIGDLVLALACCRAWYPSAPVLKGACFRMRNMRAHIAYALAARRMMDARPQAEKPNNNFLASPIARFPHILAFYKYLGDYNATPVYGKSDDDSKPAQTPWYLFAVAMTLKLNPRLTIADAWNLPIGESAWMNAAHLEASGVKIDILTPELRQAFKEANIPLEF